MLVMRLDFENGLHVEYNFVDAARATQMFKLLREAKLHGETAAFVDDAGRTADVNGAKLQAVQLVDISLETQSVIALSMLIEDLKARLMPRHMYQAQTAQQADFDERGQPVDGGAIGRNPNFS